jgi:hypothetical protein
LMERWPMSRTTGFFSELNRRDIVWAKDKSRFTTGLIGIALGDYTVGRRCGREKSKKLVNFFRGRRHTETAPF